MASYTPASNFIFTDRSKVMLLWWVLVFYVLALNFFAVCTLCMFSFLARLYESTGRAIAVTLASAFVFAFALLKC